jgi:hypothetical protein
MLGLLQNRPGEETRNFLKALKCVDEKWMDKISV